jgi:hypothetical protein
MSASEDSYAVTARTRVTARVRVTARTRITAKARVTDTLRAGRTGILAPTSHSQIHSPWVSLPWKSENFILGFVFSSPVGVNFFRIFCRQKIKIK